MGEREDEEGGNACLTFRRKARKDRLERERATSSSFSVHLTHTLLIFHLDQRPLLVYKSRAKAPGVTPADGQMPRCRICIAEELVCSGGRRDGERGYKLPLSFHVAMQTFDISFLRVFPSLLQPKKKVDVSGLSLIRDI